MRTNSTWSGDVSQICLHEYVSIKVRCTVYVLDGNQYNVGWSPHSHSSKCQQTSRSSNERYRMTSGMNHFILSPSNGFFKWVCLNYTWTSWNSLKEPWRSLESTQLRDPEFTAAILHLQLQLAHSDGVNGPVSLYEVSGSFTVWNSCHLPDSRQHSLNKAKQTHSCCNWGKRLHLLHILYSNYRPTIYATLMYTSTNTQYKV